METTAQSTSRRSDVLFEQALVLVQSGCKHNDFVQVICAQSLSLVVRMQRDTNHHQQERQTDITKVFREESFQVVCMPRDTNTNTATRDTLTTSSTSGLNSVR